jgi:hypothetical protein
MLVTGLRRLAAGAFPAVAILVSGCAAAPPAAPVNRAFDGAYRHVVSLSSVVPHGPGCPSPSQDVRAAEVRDGQFSLLYNSVQGTYLIGPVAADGTIQAEGRLASGVVRFQGRIADGRLSGVATSPNCVYAYTPA